jgi:hypothetical protein
MKWIEQVIAQREAHPSAAILAPAFALDSAVAEVLADLAIGDGRDIDKGVIFWTVLPQVGRVRVHIVSDKDDEGVPQQV